MYVILATGQSYCLTPCAIVKATCEENVIAMVKKNNPRAFLNYRLIAQRVEDVDEYEWYTNNGAIIIEKEEELMEAF